MISTREQRKLNLYEQLLRNAAYTGRQTQKNGSRFYYRRLYRFCIALYVFGKMENSCFCRMNN